MTIRGVLRSDGTVWATGYNGDGELGNGLSSADSPQYEQVAGLQGVTSIAAGRYCALALRSDGSVWAWGDNTEGELGDGTDIGRTLPVQVLYLSHVIAIACGHDHCLALESDGTVWAWGTNTGGQLGVGTPEGTLPFSMAPMQIGSFANVIAIAAGRDSSLAVKSDGTVWAWGSGSHGQLGNGSTTDSDVPVQVSGLTEIKTVAGGEDYNLAVNSKGAVYLMGRV